MTEYSTLYRLVLDKYSKAIVAEVYGHINKADVRLMTRANGTDDLAGDEPVSDSEQGDVIGDLDEDVSDDANVVSFTVAGISRRGMNDPQFQKITLEPELSHGISDIEVFSMKGNACGKDAFTFAYSFKSLFEPDFDGGINVDSLQDFVTHGELQRERVESHLALSSMPYTKKDTSDPAFVEAVRAGTSGC